ncbi:hypothetical protein PRIPAC_80398 [Pristionchus pacificus]|uniref:Uncharacterized protein n=1 Tax=Pristionchus pacificus TaxID=54126 RepID=A0A2A6CN49_PRIPA|nr:hypothetical protein PRIPAC_80398 [Pristionchus pacificus]|eukprot:PDM79624.1 hypothetical protein PRIPAC_32203 [Pristionchus pacificus]
MSQPAAVKLQAPHACTLNTGRGHWKDRLPRRHVDGSSCPRLSGRSLEGAVAQWLCVRNAIRKVTSSTPPALRSTQTKGVKK